MKKSGPNKLAIFDFDGTLTFRDTTILFIFHYCGMLKGALHFVSNFPYILLALGGWFDWKNVKEKIFSDVLGNHSKNSVKEIGDDFSLIIIPTLLNPAVYDEMKKLQLQGFEIALLSASCSVWLNKWCEHENIKLLCSELEIKEGVYTGRLAGENCFGKEKVNRLRSVYELDRINEIVAWGNHKSDFHYMKLASKAYLVRGHQIIPFKHEV